MNDSLYIAATGMQAQQQNIDAIANNLANVSTAGFKRGRVNFQEMMHVDPNQAAGAAAAPLGLGISVGSVAKDFAPGALTQTGAQLDLAINGAGFIEVTMADGSRGYTRGGTLQVSKDSYLATAAGHVLKPSIHIPANAAQIQIAADGKVSVQSAVNGPITEIGQIELANFANPSALGALASGVYAPTEASGEANYGKAGAQGMGTLAQGALENSNVNLVDEMVTLMIAQRAYEMSSKVIQASDEMMGLTNNLRR
jgi:flagellar basal-body rod protein FlgG